MKILTEIRSQKRTNYYCLQVHEMRKHEQTQKKVSWLDHLQKKEPLSIFKVEIIATILCLPIYVGKYVVQNMDKLMYFTS